MQFNQLKLFQVQPEAKYLILNCFKVGIPGGPGFWASTAGGRASIPGGGNKIPQAIHWCGQKNLKTKQNYNISLYPSINQQFVNWLKKNKNL